MIYEWKNIDYRNFGDAFTELILEQMDPEEARAMAESTTEMHFLLGSHLTSQLIFEIYDRGFKPVFHGCGWRGKDLNPTFAAMAEFRGCRGPFTQESLRRVGLNVPYTGDPAYALLDKLDIQPNPSGLSYLVPHVLDKSAWEYIPEDYKVDVVEEAKVWTRLDVLDKIEKFSSADFVLAGSMHACIVADYYDVPFAPFMGGHVDCPPKWEDWLASRGYNSNAMRFVDSLDEGLDWYERHVHPRKNRSRV